jgi:hypothetical protein
MSEAKSAPSLPDEPPLTADAKHRAMTNLRRQRNEYVAAMLEVHGLFCKQRRARLSSLIVELNHRIQLLAKRKVAP